MSTTDDAGDTPDLLADLLAVIELVEEQYRQPRPPLVVMPHATDPRVPPCGGSCRWSEVCASILCGPQIIC